MDESISQFISITGASSEQARFYVDSAGGDVQEAVSTYFEAEGAEGDSGATGEEQDDQDATVVPAAPSGPRTLSGAPAPALPSEWGSGSAAKPSSSSRAAAPSGGSARLATLSDFRGQAASGRRDDDDDDDEDSADADDDDGRDPVNFFAGGERSGLSVQNPDHGRRRANRAPEVVQDILQRAREMAQRRAGGGGGEDDDDDDWGEGGSATKKVATSSAFSGQGRSLADAAASEGSAQAAGGSAAPSSSTGAVPGSFELAGQGAAPPAADVSEAEIANRRIIFWQDGFSLEDGPLCQYDDPQHAQTLAMINQGAAPLSFLNVRFGQRVNLTVEQRHEKYTPPPPPPMKPFGGSGNRLGSPAPATTTTAAAATASTATAGGSSSGAAAPSAFEVDSAQPTTQLQIRLADGQRVVGRFNHTHTITDVRNYINASHPAMAQRSYVLQTSFPPKPITDEAQSLSQAGLINAVVIQKWT